MYLLYFIRSVQNYNRTATEYDVTKQKRVSSEEPTLKTLTVY